jgi:hypothetical protein
MCLVPSTEIFDRHVAGTSSLDQGPEAGIAVALLEEVLS